MNSIDLDQAFAWAVMRKGIVRFACAGTVSRVIGVAALHPAEFVIFRIGQWTADRKD